MESKFIDAVLGLAVLGTVVGIVWVMTGNAPAGDDTAAWVQAFGSIGAILGATWIARLQSLDQRRRDERERREREQQKIDEFRANVSVILQRMRIAQTRLSTLAASLEKDDCLVVDQDLLERVRASRDAMERCDHGGSDGLVHIIEQSATALRSAVAQIERTTIPQDMVVSAEFRRSTIERLARNVRETTGLLADDVGALELAFPPLARPTPGS